MASELARLCPSNSVQSLPTSKRLLLKAFYMQLPPDMVLLAIAPDSLHISQLDCMMYFIPLH